MMSGITGVGDVYLSRGEYASDEMVEEYNRLINQIKDCLEKEDYAGLQNAMDGLVKLAKTPPYFTRTMAENLDLVFFYMKKNGLEPGKTLDPETGLGNLRKLKDYQIPGTKDLTFTKLLTSVVGNVEHENLTVEEYIKLALLVKSLPALEAQLNELTEALELNNSVIDILKKINDLRNRCTSDPVKEEVPPIPKRGDYPNDANGEQAYQAAMQNRENIIKRNAQKGPTINFTPAETKELLELKGKLEQKLKDLEKLGITPDGEGNLPDRIKQIVTDLDTLFVDVKNFTKDFPADMSQWTEAQKAQYDEALKNGLGSKETRYWLMDGQDGVGPNAGKFANSLADAVTAAENLSSDQTNKIQQAKTVMDNIIKEIGSCLEKISSTIISFARGIGKSTS